jgi:hypothetical protein
MCSMECLQICAVGMTGEARVLYFELLGIELSVTWTEGRNLGIPQIRSG